MRVKLKAQIFNDSSARVIKYLRRTGQSMTEESTEQMKDFSVHLIISLIL